MTGGGLARLELSPFVPNGLALIPVSRTEIAMLCTEGLDVRFHEHGLLPESFSIVRRNGAVYGNVWTAAMTPIGAAKHWLAFDLRTENYAGKGEHAPFALFLDAATLTAPRPAIVGNGMIFGDVHLAPNGCGGPSSPLAPIFNTQVEAFFATGIHLWTSTCGSEALVDGPTYHIALQAGTDGTVSFTTATNGMLISTPPAAETLAERPSFDTNNGGVLLASTSFCPGCGDYALRVSNVVSGWSTQSGFAPPLAANAKSLAFAPQQTGLPSPPRAVAFTNAGPAALDVQFDIAAASGPHCVATDTSADCAKELDAITRSFRVADAGCHPVLPGKTCTASITFEPQGAFRMGASLAYRAADLHVPAVSLEGVGVPAAPSGEVAAIEYFDPALEHYFITTLPTEIALLDAGAISGWIRTGQWFLAYPGAANPGNGHSPVCRFYGRPEAGLDSHFYSASPAECASVIERFPDAWQIETENLFGIGLPDTGSGACPSGSESVYRLYNGRTDANHRYTTEREVRSEMITAGWIGEGYGPLGVVMCAPSQ